jgi:hypothetical protein
VNVKWYRLVDRKVIEEEEVDVSRWQSHQERRIALDQWGDIRVSTVFLCIDHRFGLNGPPILFETMVFWPGHELDESQERYETIGQAEIGHMRWVEIVKMAMKEAGVDDSG